MQSRRKRVRRGDGSVYRINGKRERWKSRIVGINRRVQGSMDWTKQSVWKKGSTRSAKGKLPKGTKEQKGKKE
jgi:hypothetical protein